jgi:hypothetical protein
MPVSESGVQGVTVGAAAARFVGGSAGGAPAGSVPALAGDFVIDQTGPVWVCTSAGTPGTWASTSGRFLCTPTAYTPSGQTLLQTCSATMAPLACAGTTVAAGSNGGEISTVASWSSPSAGVLDVASTTGFPATGSLYVVASSTGPALITYSGTAGGNQFTGCAYVSGSATGTVATGGNVTNAAGGAVASTGSFTAPASQDVVVTAYFVSQVSSSANAVGFGLCAHGTVTPMVGNVTVFKDPASTQPYPHVLSFLVTGLTAGNSYNFDLMFATAGGGAGGTGLLSVYADNQTSTSPTLSNAGTGAPVVMTVQAV